MADINLGTFEITQLTRSPYTGPGAGVSRDSYGANLTGVYTGPPGQQPTTLPSLSIYNITSATISATLGTQYEVILREVPKK